MASRSAPMMPLTRGAVFIENGANGEGADVGRNSGGGEHEVEPAIDLASALYPIDVEYPLGEGEAYRISCS